MKKIEVFAFELRTLDTRKRKLESETLLVNCYRGEFFTTPEMALAGARRRISESDGIEGPTKYALDGKSVTENTPTGETIRVWVEMPVTITPQIVFIDEK